MSGKRERRRSFLLWLAFVILLVGAPTAYAQQWPPAVIVQSSSMMHWGSDVGYGRVGTIDPGDLVLVKDIDSPDDVRTFVEGGDGTHGAPGDVIIYYRAGDRSLTPIIHRAMAYVEVDRSGGAPEYRVRWDPARACEGGATKDPFDARWCVYGEEGILVPSASIHARDDGPYVPNANGFVTKGDNPRTNQEIDQLGISYDEQGKLSVVHLDWIEGKGRGEIPWLGLIKLAISKEPNEDRPPASYVQVGNAFAPGDLWVMLAVTLAVLIGGPIAYDAWQARRARHAPR